MKQINVFLFVVFVLVSSVTNAQDYSLKMGLSQIPFRDFPYKERSLPGGRTDGFIIDFDPNIEGKLYEDLQCKQYSLAKNNTDFFPEVYLKIQLSNGLYLGALSFGGCTEYRTDVMFISDANGNVKDTLECCVLNGDLAVKQYEVKSPEEIIIYRMFFAMPVPMKWENNGNVKDTLECCVLNGDLAVKQYEVKSPEEIIIYRMFFAMPVPMKWENMPMPPNH